MCMQFIFLNIFHFFTVYIILIEIKKNTFYLDFFPKQLSCMLFILFFFVFLVTPYLIVAVQHNMESIRIEKKGAKNKPSA